MLKFRTMVEDAETQQLELEAQNEAAGPMFKIRTDPRVTRVGALLRRSSIDELPSALECLAGRDVVGGPRAPYRCGMYSASATPGSCGVSASFPDSPGFGK